jgi:hypothetical protein
MPSTGVSLSFLLCGCAIDRLSWLSRYERCKVRGTMMVLSGWDDQHFFQSVVLGLSLIIDEALLNWLFHFAIDYFFPI